MITIYLDFNRENGVEIVSSSALLSPALKLAVVLKSLPLGAPPDEVLKSFPVGQSDTVFSHFKMVAESGHGCALLFHGRRDIDVFKYEHTLKAAVDELAKGNFPQYLSDKPIEPEITPINVPKRFDLAIQSLLDRLKTAVVGDSKSVRNMIAFLVSLVPVDYRGYLGLTVWCNTLLESGELIGLPTGLLDDVEMYLDAATDLGAVIDVSNRKTLGRESTDFSKEIAQLIGREEIDQTKQKLARVFSDAFSISHGEKRDTDAEEGAVTRLIAKRFFGYGGPTEDRR